MHNMVQTVKESTPFYQFLSRLASTIEFSAII